MPQLEQINTFSSQLFWLVICFVALFLVMRFVAIPRITSVLEKRRDRVSGDLEKAASLKEEAEKTLAEYEAAVADGRAKAQEVIRQMTEEMSAKSAAEHAELGKRVAKQIDEAEDRIEAAKREALDDIQSVAADVAQSAAERLAGVKVDKRSANSAVKAAAEARR